MESERKKESFGTSIEVEYDLQSLIQIATEVGMTAAFSHTHYSSKPRFFVFPVNVPEKFRPYVLLHEVVESDHQGIAELCIIDITYELHVEGQHNLAEQYSREEMEFAHRYPHTEACLVELKQVFKHG